LRLTGGSDGCRSGRELSSRGFHEHQSAQGRRRGLEAGGIFDGRRLTTGDLAHKKLFPALQAMVKRGYLDVPVIGVARTAWAVEAFRGGDARARS
jgi:Glucose-6-phosphate dehydrogenase, NAD binding domain